MRSAVWRGAVSRYVLPRLPGEWAVHSTLMYRMPAEWVLTGVGMVSSQFGGHFWHELVAQPLFVPARGWQPVGVRLGHGHEGGEGVNEFASVADGEGPMWWLADRLADGGLETLDRLGTLDGLLGEYERRAELDPANVNWWEVVAGLAVLLGDGERVVRAGRAADAAAEVDQRAWVTPIRERTMEVVRLYGEGPARAVAELERRAEQTRRAVIGPAET